MAEIPNLAGVVTKDLIETIGSGSFKASYVNWSRTLNLLRQAAPGWMPQTDLTEDGSLVHRAPVGGYLMIRFVHVDGTTTPAVPQAIMDTRNQAIAFDKITARDITDTQRRGTCLAASYFFGLAYELWAKMPVESGYDAQLGKSSDAPERAMVQLQQDVPKPSSDKAVKSVVAIGKEEFIQAATGKGLCQEAIDKLLEVINGKYETGIKTLKSKNAAWVKEQNAPFAKVSSGEAW